MASKKPRSQFVLFFLRGYTNEEMQKAKPCTLEGLEIRIQKVLNNIQDDIFQKVIISTAGCLRNLVETSGAYVKT